MKTQRVMVVMSAFLLATFGTLAIGQLMARGMPMRNAGVEGGTNLPYVVNDNKGENWRIYPGGNLQNQGPTPQGGNTSTYSQSAVLAINGNNVAQNNNQAKLDPKTGELTLDGLVAGSFTVTRHILVDKNDGYVRYIDVIKNNQGQDQSAQVMLTGNLNYGINSSQMVMDPKKPSQTIGWAAQTGSMACVFEMYAGKDSKIVPQVMAQQGNSMVQATYSLKIPAGKEVALMHLHGMTPAQEAGAQFMLGLKEHQLLKTIPHELRRLIVNFAGGQGFIGDLEVLRGDMLDVVELKSGDQLKGTLKESAYDVDTFYGSVKLPVDQVVGIISVGNFRPRQLVVTSDGQVFGGKLKKEMVDLQLSSGQVTQVPLSQISRIGYHKRPGEPEEWTYEKPLVLMRSGERVDVKPPSAPVEVATPYGKLSIKPEQLGALVLQTEDNGVHQALLRDGSRLSGILTADTLDMNLDSGDGQAVKFPVSALTRFQLTPKIAEIDDDTPSLKMANDDVLVGTVTGHLKVDTTFDTIEINASEIKSLTRVKGSASDVQVVLFDGTTVSGSLEETELPVQLGCGLSLKAPLALVTEYLQPEPEPSKEMADRIKKLVADLNNPDWKTRDRAQAALTHMGTVAIKTLKQLRVGQPPEAQKAFDTILKELEKQRGSANTSAAPAVPTPMLLNKD